MLSEEVGEGMGNYYKSVRTGENNTDRGLDAVNYRAEAVPEFLGSQYVHEGGLPETVFKFFLSEELAGVEQDFEQVLLLIVGLEGLEKRSTFLCMPS